MAILLPVKPDILMHFENGGDRDVYKYGGHPQFSLIYDHNKFGKSAALLNMRFNHYIDTTKSFTLSYWIYDHDCADQNQYLSFNREVGSLRAGLEFGWAYNGGYRVCCMSHNYTTSYDCDIRDSSVYPISQDAAVLIHLEFSFDSTTKIFRIFRNGVIAWQQTLSFYIDNIAKNLTLWLTATNTSLYIDELLLIQTCLHTAAFTPPAEPYIWLDGPRTAKDQNNKLYGYK